jgi:hypothetical protein
MCGAVNQVSLCAIIEWAGKGSSFYCIGMSSALQVFVIYYTNKFIWIDGLLSKISDFHVGN